MAHSTRFTITSEIQQHGDAVLYRGYRTADRVPVAIKLSRSDGPDRRVLAKLRHEYAILQDLSLAGVVKTYGIEKDGSRLALLLEDFGGSPLDIVLKTRSLDLRSTLKIAASVADALASIHQHDIIHKDIKPHNILVHTDTWAAQLIGFGIATRLARETQGPAERLDTLEGTLAYMSPEQTGRMNRALDDRTDLYSLGVTLYEMLTGVLPFQSTDPAELVHSHIARRPTPPREVSPEIPQIVSDIVMKLLAKAAEDRYETASGLAADLNECLAQLSATGRVDPFPLGRRDRSGKLRLPQKLYGREEETKALGSAWQRASSGAAEVFLVSGYAGVGKSVLIQDIHQFIARDGGHFIQGKFDQLDRITPYAPVARAFRELVQELLAEPAEALESWKRRVQLALGSNGRLLVDLVPELELLIGPQPSVPSLGLIESQNRFARVFQSFLRTVAARGCPLALFLDDLQWIDPASLNLIEQLLSDPDRGYLLVLGAYRDNEVDKAHPLMLAMERLRAAGVTVSQVTLQPLSLPDATQFVADALGSDAGAITKLAELAWSKTHGNPFFLNQFLRALEQEKLLAFDAPSGSWIWDIQRIEARMVTDNVVEFMAGKILQLPENTRRVLKLAACIGHEFDLSSLAMICERAPGDVTADLWEALREGLVLPLHPEYRFLDARVDDDAEAPLSRSFHVSYRFLHDRVQQAAYSAVEEGERNALHLRIGRILLAKSGAEPQGKALFDITNHLNLGVALIDDPGERVRLARLNLAAGRRAKESAAFQTAADYCRAGLSLLGEADWKENYELTFALHLERAECEFMIGAFDAVESSIDILLGHARSHFDQARVHKLHIAVCCARSQFDRAIDIARTALSRFGIDYPETTEARIAAATAEVEAVRANLVGRRLEDLRQAPMITDPDKKTATALLRTVGPAAYFVDAFLTAFGTMREVNIALQYGLSEFSPSTFAAYAMTLCGWLNQYEEAYAFGTLAMDLCERFGAVEQRCPVSFLVGTVSSFCRPLRSSLDYFAQAHHAGLESGDHWILCMNAWRAVDCRLGLGDELGAVAEEADRALALTQRVKNPVAETVLRISKQMIANLRGRTRSRSSLSDETFDEEAFAGALSHPMMVLAADWYYTVKLELATLYEDHETALAMARLGDSKSVNRSTAHAETDRIFFLCLACCGLRSTRTAAEQEEPIELLAKGQHKLAELADSCPENFLHKKLLVEAERARIEGDELSAMNLYGAAIDAAGKNEFLHHEALANELAAKFHLAKGRRKIALIHLRDAYQGYLRWGATAKAADLAGKYPQLDVQTVDAPAMGVSVRATTTGKGSAILDMATVHRAAQTIAGEIVLEKILDRLMRLAIEHAGAQRGALLRLRDGKLTLDATITLDPDKVTIGPPALVETCAEIPLSVVHYVERTGEPVVLGDASRKGRFAGDPYIAERQTKSLLCLALMHQQKLTGVLYLENNAATDVFTPARIDLCALLSSQAAIALENARLVARAEATAGELRRANEALEERIADRTKELREANERLRFELGERERAEAERERLQEEIIRTQRERLSEMSTPLIPITDGIMVMPLIGTVDQARACQMLETVVEGASSRQAAAVIIDITGVKVVDTSVAAMLVSAAGALKLIGAQAVLTGIRPEVARTLVQLGVELRSIVTKGSLQSGIAYALRHSGEKQLLPPQGAMLSRRSG
ncbi:AAA family ATPase [Sorangium sp. So ce1128]